jgi:hypothetical protein
MMEVASIVTLVFAAVGMLPPIKAGAVKVRGCQSSKKKPIVGATGGSTPGTIVVSPGNTGGGGGDGSSTLLFLQDAKKHIAVIPIKHLIKYRLIKQVYYFV